MFTLHIVFSQLPVVGEIPDYPDTAEINTIYIGGEIRYINGMSRTFLDFEFYYLTLIKLLRESLEKNKNILYSWGLG